LSGKSKFSDAGEPSGSAGIRILNAIDHFELTDCMVVVIRYFGGTKLGIGPLGKAYFSASFQALSASNIITKKPYLQAEIKLAISSFNKLNKLLTSNQIKVVETVYGSEITLKFLVPFDLLEKIKVKITEILKSEVVFTINDEIVYR
jgi:putative IMPACT (imprinted ancient) family translation regulator